jgi:hypothetical protein
MIYFLTRGLVKLSPRSIRGGKASLFAAISESG